MQAIDIANEALDSVLGNLKAALKISIPVLILNLVLVAVLGFDIWQALFSGNEQKVTETLSTPVGVLRVFFIPSLFIIVSMYWVTVAWHRYVILEEQPGAIFPKFNLGRIWAYIWRLLVLVIVIALGVILPLALLSSIMGGGGRVNVADYSEALRLGPMAVVFNVIGTMLFTYVFLRYSPFLVAAAIGQPIRASTGRESTLWARGDIMLLAVGYAVITLITTFVGGGMQTGFWPVDLAIILALQWVAFMFTISLITTLYQKSAEKNARTELVENDKKSKSDLAFYSRWRE